MYFDSSVILTMLLQQDGCDFALKVWESSEQRFCSRLVEIEALIGIRRLAARMPGKLSEAWQHEQTQLCAKMLEEVALIEISEPIVAIIRQQARLASCRALDAIHLATALALQPLAPADFKVCTFDRRMRAAAEEFEIKLCKQ